MRFFKHTASSVLFAAIGVVSLGVSGASANHQWADFHWALPSSDGLPALIIDVNNCQDDPHPSYYNVVDQFSGPNDDWDTEILLAGGVFSVQDVIEEAPCPDVDSTNTATQLDNSIGDRSTPYDHTINSQGTVNAFNADYGNNGWVGLAIVQIDNDLTGDNHIIYGEAHLNDYYPLNFAPTYDYPLVMRKVQCQEIGHTLGLDHIKQDKSCMYSSRAKLGSVYTPNGHDGEMVNSITHIHDGTTPPPDDGGKGGPPCGTPKGGPCPNGIVIGKAI